MANVGSVDSWITTELANTFTVSQNATYNIIKPPLIKGNLLFAFNQDVPVVVAANVSGNVTGCSGYLFNTLAGKIIFVQRGTCTFSGKARHAKIPGAVGMIIANNVEDFLVVNMDPKINFPTFGVAKQEGKTIDTLLKTGPATVKAPEDYYQSVDSASGQMPSFSASTFRFGFYGICT